MKDATRKEIENMFSLFKLFAGAVLVGHFGACSWCYIGKQVQGERGWITVLEEGITVNGQLV